MSMMRFGTGCWRYHGNQILLHVSIRHILCYITLLLTSSTKVLYAYTCIVHIYRATKGGDFGLLDIWSIKSSLYGLECLWAKLWLYKSCHE